MSRLLFHVEGETEETFVNEVLAPHLYKFGYQKISARLVGNSRNRSRRGGIRAWPSVREDIVNHLREDPGSIATTLVDYYALPQQLPRGWPGRAEAALVPFDQKAPTLHRALHLAVCAEMGQSFDSTRFVPFVMMHEFEALLFSDCARFADAVGRPELRDSFQRIRDAFSSPEEINDSPHTAPSKRVEGLIPGYEKPFLGVLAALDIGLETLRRECLFFGSWIKQLEARSSH